MDGFSEAQRWLNVAERLLAMRDLQSARTFAIRAHEADPRLDLAERILSVADTLLAAESNSFIDYYAVLQIVRGTQNMELIASQYRKLALMLNPNVNRLPYADQAFTMVCEAWAVLSNGARKAVYDGQLGLGMHVGFQQQWVQQPQVLQWNLGGSSSVAPQQPQQQQRVVGDGNWLSFVQQEQQATQVNQHKQQQQEPSQQATKEAPKVVENEAVEEEKERTVDDDVGETGETGFWTACPYCFYLYEYPKKYEECALRCQHCERAFEAVAIPGPPIKGKSKYFCCWGYYPLGCSGNVKKSGWSPVSPMFACPGGGKGKKVVKVVYSDEDVSLEVSSDDSDDDDWTTTSTTKKRKKKTKSGKGRSAAGKNVRSGKYESGKKGVQSNGGNGEKVNGGPVTRASSLSKGESSRNGVGTSGNKPTGRVTRGMGRLDLNIEFSNEVEEPAAAPNEGNDGNKAESGEDDNIEGTGFFEGLDEFLSTLPILNVVGGEDKVKAA